MNAHQMERAAYIAAHRLLTTDLTAPELACPGARRSALVDNIAKVIKGVYEAHSQRFDATTDWWPEEAELDHRDDRHAGRHDDRHDDRRDPLDDPGTRAVIALLKS